MIPSTIETARGSFGYFAEGDPGAPLILFLHGFPDSAHALLPMLSSAARSGYRAVAPFLRGYAPSVLGGPYDLDSLAADVSALADAFGAQRFALVGHDWGAAITYVACRSLHARINAAVTLSVPHPLSFARALATNRAQLRRSWYMGFFQLKVAERVVAANDFAFLNRLFASWSPSLVVDREALARVKQAIAPGFPAALEYYRAFMRSPARALRGWSPITVPLLHLTGAEDGCIGPEVGRDQHCYFAAPFASEVIDGAGHFLPWECPERISERALAWIAAHP